MTTLQDHNVLDANETQHDDTTEESLHIIAKRAARVLADTIPGALIPHDVFDGMVGLEPLPRLTTPLELQRRALTRLQLLGLVRNELLYTHKRDLGSAHGKGYVLVPPNIQGGVASDDFTRATRNQLKRLRHRINNVDTGGFTAIEKKDLSDLKAKAALMEHKFVAALKDVRPFRKTMPPASTTPFSGKWAS